MRHFFPFLEWIPRYKKSYIKRDILAGLTVAIVLIPQGMAYALVAGLPAVYGLYASLVPVFMYALLGTSRGLGVGPVAMDSLLVAAGLGAIASIGPDNYIAMAILLAFMVGCIQLVLGLLRMGFLVNFLSKPVISGFTSGAALIIMCSQLKHLLGTDIERSNQLHTMLMNAIQKLGDTNPYDLAIGISGILIMVLFKRWNRKIPYILLVVVLGILAVYYLDLSLLGVKIVGNIPAGLPVFSAPQLEIDVLAQLWPIALTLALIGYLEAISIGKSIEDKNNEDRIDPNQELVSLGMANITGSFFQSYPITASFSRSAIYNEARSKTNMATIITVLIVLGTILFLTPLFYFLPKAALASIIMVSVFGLIDFSYTKRLWKYRRDEFVVLLGTFSITLFIGIMPGIVVGVLISLLLMVYRTSNPHFAELGKIKNTNYYKNIKRFGSEALVRDDVLIVRFDAQLYFGNANYFKTKLFKLIHAKGPALEAVILNAEAINYIDSTASNMLRRVIEKLYEQGIHLFITGAIGPTRDILFTSGIMEVLPKECLFVETKEAVTFFDDPQSRPKIESSVAYQRNKVGN
jgi:SulP family sulfate permease